MVVAATQPEATPRPSLAQEADQYVSDAEAARSRLPPDGPGS
jgi:hypothetical protein